MVPKLFRLSSVDEANRAATFTASTGAFVRSTEKDEDGNDREVFESIQAWDLEAYTANPVVLYQHAHEEPIGQAETVDPTDDGLEIRVKFASAQASEQAEKTWKLLREGVLRAGSVGFEVVEVLSEELREGVPYRTVKARLLEFSIVSVPADSGALAKGKDEVVRVDVGRISKAEILTSGGARFNARLSRIGVFKYLRPDGTVSRELKPPDEMFHPDALATLRSVPLTRNHPYAEGGRVNAETWRRYSVGHVENGARDGDYLQAPVVVNDIDALEDIDQGELQDISAGYVCVMDRTPGVWNGQPYDVVHRRIRWNHAALLPPGHGRAGRDVGLVLDATDAVCVEEVTVMEKVILDGKEYVKGSPEHLAALEAMTAKLQTRLDEAEEELRKRSEEEESEEERKKREAAEAEEERKRAEAEEKKEQARKARDKRWRKLAARALRLGLLDEEEEEKLDSLSERELMLSTIQKSDPEFTGEGRSDDYIEARFDLLQSVVRNDSLDAIVSTVVGGKHAPKSLPADEAALAKLHERNRNAWREAK